MKKIYLLAFSALLVSGTFAQSGKKMAKSSSLAPAKASTAKVIKNNPNEVAATYFTSDFSNAAQWTITSQGSGTDLWVIGTTPASGTFSGSYGEIQSTTAANGYALFDSDSDCSGDQIAELTSTSFSTTGSTAIRLVFQEHYVRWYDSTIVYVSNDGGTVWNPFPVTVNNNTPIEGGPTTVGANPTTVTMDISSAAANQADVKIRFTFYSNAAAFGATNAGCGYMWYIDDVVVEDVPSEDLALTAINLPDDACGLSAASTISMDITNTGLTNVSNFSVSYVVDGGTPVVETYTATLNAGQTATYTFTTTADFSGVGVHTVDGLVTLTGEVDVANNSATAEVETFPIFTAPYANSFEGVGDDYTNLLIYNVAGASNWAPDNNFPNTGTRELIVFEADGGGNPVAGVSDQWLITNCFQLNAGTSYTVKYFAQGFTGFGGELSISYGSNNNPAAMTNLIKPLTAPSMGAYAADSAAFTPAASGIYYFGFRVYQADPAANTAFLLDDISVFETPSVGIKANAASEVVSVFPNPNAGVFTVKATENNSSVAVYSIIGENVYSSKLVKGNNSIDLTNLAAGSYVVKVNNGGTLVTKRVVINK